MRNQHANHTLRISHESCVLVCDGRKALFLRNEGNELYPNLQVVDVLEAPENPSTQNQGSDRPGRTSMGDRRSTYWQTDWHQLGEQRFATDVAAALETYCARRKVPAVVIAAPPRTLTDLRKVLPASVSRLVIAEVHKELTKLPVHEIERHLMRG